MMIMIRRFGRAVLIAGLVFAMISTVHAQEKTPFPTLSDKRVYVSGVPDRYQALEAHINRLERSSPQTYYVVVVKSTGSGAKATTTYAQDLFKHWVRQAASSRRSFDSDRSVLIVLGVDNEQIAIHPGALLSKRYGMHAEMVDVIQKTFIPFARKQQYPEGLAALLNDTNDAIAAIDGETGRVPVKVTAPNSSSAASKITASGATKAATGATTPYKSSSSPTQSTTQVDARNQPALPVRSSSDWMSGLAVIGPMLLALIALAVGALWWGYRRTRYRIGGRIKEVKAQAVDVMDRLDSLKERLKLLPTSPEFKEPMAGETQVLYRSAKEKSDKLWDGWLHVMEVLDKSQKLADRSGSLFSQKTLGEAEKLIEQRGSFKEIVNQSQEIAKSVDQLDRAHPAARAVLEALNETRPKLTGQLEAIAKLDLPTKPYQEQLDLLAAETKQAGAAMVADPLGTQSVLETLREKTNTYLERIGRITTLFAESAKVKGTLETIRRQVASHRAQGLKLVEAGGNPDTALGQAETAQAEILSALRAGDPETGAVKLNAAQASVQEAQATIEGVQKARSFCERDATARVRETERLRMAISQGESYQAELERDFAPSSWSGMARNLEQANALLATFDRQVQDAVAAASSNKQEYLKGAGLLEELARQQQIVLRLMSGLGEQLNSLIAVRDDSRKLIDDLAGRERQAEALIRQNEHVVGDVARQSMAKAQQVKREILSRTGTSRPDWPAVRQSLAEAIEDMSIARSQAEDDIKNFEELNREFEQTRRTASRVYALLTSHQEDRLAANQHYQAAASALDRIALVIQEPRGAAAAWLAQVRDAAGDLKRSEELAREDIRLAAQAQATIGEGAAAIRQAQGYAGMGIGSDTSSAQSQLMQAEQLLQSQNYEQSIQYAGAATQSARQVYYAAMQQAMLQQMAAEAEQRRRAARMAAPAWDGVSFGAVAATTAAATILENAVSASAAPAREPEPATAGGSWSGETAQGSW